MGGERVEEVITSYVFLIFILTYVNKKVNKKPPLLGVVSLRL
jgi:hypothetical protein